MTKERIKGKGKVKLPTCTVEPELLSDLDKYCSANSKYRSNVVERAIEIYLCLDPKDLEKLEEKLKKKS